MRAPDTVAIADLAYDAACTLWHVTDWIANSGNPKLQAIVTSKGCRNPDPTERAQAFQRQLRTESDELEICWALALHFKHFEVEPNSKARNVIERAPTMSDVVQYSVSASVPAVDHIASTHVKVTSKGGRLRVTDVYASAYGFLDGLLKKHGL